MASEFVADRWVLEVWYPPISEQEKDDPENAFPNDYVSTCVRHISKAWGGLPEDLPTFCEWSESYFKVTTDTLDSIDGLLRVICMETIPTRLVLE
jgi:hypothetical protein